MSDIELFVDRANGSPKRLVQAYYRGAEVYRSTLDVDNDWQRQCFAKEALDRAGIPTAFLTDDDMVAIRRGETPVTDKCKDLADRLMKKAIAEDQKAAQATSEAEITYQRYTCQQLDDEEFQIIFLIAWILVSGQPCIVAGGKKTLKTSLLIALAIALATGHPFLGKFKVERAVRVLMMSGESGMATIQESARRIAASMGLDLAEITGLMFSPDLPQIGHLLHHDALEKMLREDEVEVLILDPLYLCLMTEGNEGSLFAMGGLLRGISELCQRCGTTLLLAHHTKKTINDPFAVPELEHISWAGCQEFVRQWILIGRREQYEPGTGRHRLWMNVGGSAGHSSCWALDIQEGAYDGGKTPRRWEVDLMRADEARREAEERQQTTKAEKASSKQAGKIEAAAKRLIQAAVRYPDGETKRTLFDTAGLSNAMGNLALSAAIDAKAIIPCDVMKGNQKTPREGYKLRPDEDETEQCDQCDKSSATE